MRQTFRANTVTVSGPDEPLTVAFGDLNPNQSVIHSLMFIRDDEHEGPKSIYMEFNDQSNACWGPSIESVALGPDRLKVVLRDKGSLRTGRVDGLSDDFLSELEVSFAVPPDTARQVRNALQTLLSEGCGLSVL